MKPDVVSWAAHFGFWCSVAGVAVAAFAVLVGKGTPPMVDGMGIYFCFMAMLFHQRLAKLEKAKAKKP